MRAVIISIVTLAALVGATSPAFARWGSPAPQWFAHSCASPGARFANAKYCSPKTKSIATAGKAAAHK